jgi:hypothetical protein
MRFMTASLLGVFALAWFSLASPGEGAGVNVRGKVTKLTPAEGDAKKRGELAVILVVGPQDNGATYDKASVKITAKTIIRVKVGKRLEDGKLEDLHEGDWVVATFTGPVAESDPVQATATAIVIYTGAK